MSVFSLHHQIIPYGTTGKVAIRIFHWLVSSARLYRRRHHGAIVFQYLNVLASLLLFSGMNDSCVPGGSVTYFEIGRTTLCEEDTDVTMNPPCILSQVWINFVFA